MANWFVGLATRQSAERACKWGSIACLFEAAHQMFSAGFHVSNIGGLVGATILPVLFVVSAIRMWRRGGWIMGSLLALIATADLALSVIRSWAEMVAYTRLVSDGKFVGVALTAAYFAILVTRVAIAGLIINGVRGVLALQKVDYSKGLLGVFS